MPDPTFALTGYVNSADLASAYPKTAQRYAFVVSTGRAYYWDNTATDAIDNTSIIGDVSHTGRWRAVNVVVTSDAGANLTDADATILVAAGKLRKLPASTLTNNRTLTLGTTGATTGSQIEIVRFDISAFTYAIANGGPAAGTICTMPISVRAHALLEFDGTNWFQRNSNPML